jgi:hypothetical protein
METTTDLYVALCLPLVVLVARESREPLSPSSNKSRKRKINGADSLCASF